MSFREGGMAQIDRAYMENHLIDYVLFQVQQGYAPDDVYNVLLKYGYPNPVVQEVFKQLAISIKEEFKRHAQKRGKDTYNQLDEEMHQYLVGLLIDYVTKEQKQGYSIPVIKKALLQYGHHKEIIHEALQTIQQGKVKDYHVLPSLQFSQQAVFALCLILFFIFFVFLGIATNTSLMAILLNFGPAVLSFAFMNALLSVLLHRRLILFLPLLGLLLAVGLFILAVRYAGLFVPSDANVILILNAGLSFVATVLLCLFSKEKVQPVEKVMEKKKVGHAKANKLEKTVMRSEEDQPLGDILREEIQRIDASHNKYPPTVRNAPKAEVLPREKKVHQKSTEPKIPLKAV